MQGRDQMSHLEPETSESILAPQESLDMVATLLSQPRHWNEWLSQYPERSDLFAETFRFVVRLEQATCWEIEVVLSELGCRTKTTDQLGRMEERQLESCCEYFAWVESLVSQLSGIDERRQVVSGAALLFRDAQGDLGACRHALGAGEFSGSELLALGEVERAWEISRLRLESPIGGRARAVRDFNPFAVERPHLSDERLDRYIEGDRHLDSVMCNRIAEHLDLCSECKQAYEARLAARDADPAVSAAS